MCSRTHCIQTSRNHRLISIQSHKLVRVVKINICRQHVYIKQKDKTKQNNTQRTSHRTTHNAQRLRNDRDIQVALYFQIFSCIFYSTINVNIAQWIQINHHENVIKISVLQSCEKFWIIFSRRKRIFAWEFELYTLIITPHICVSFKINVFMFCYVSVHVQNEILSALIKIFVQCRTWFEIEWLRLNVLKRVISASEQCFCITWRDEWRIELIILNFHILLLFIRNEILCIVLFCSERIPNQIESMRITLYCTFETINCAIRQR